MTEGEERREAILKELKSSSLPVSGTALAGKLHVSRQIVVQDIALLRAGNKNILSTNKGYVLYEPDLRRYRRTFHVTHNDEQIEDELNCIVDNNGKVLDVVVEHEVYGQITVDLILNSRRDVREFLEKLHAHHTRTLKDLTGDVHYHTVEADRIDDLDVIEDELRKKGFLLE